MILVYIEVREGKVKKSSLEVLSEAKRRADELGQEVYGVLVGHGLESLAAGVINYGANKVIVLDSPLLSSYSPSGFAHVLSGFCQDLSPEGIFFPATSMGKDLAPRLAALLGASLASDCIQTAVVDGALEVVRPIFAGKAFATFRFKSSPVMVTLRPNVFPLGTPTDGQGGAEKRDVAVPDDQALDRVVEVLKEEGADLDVTEAEIVVSGGRGLKGPENFDLLRGLTEILPHSAVGASRSAVDAGWIDHQHQVGQTGKTVSPNLYMAFGISGAIQHLAGMSSSKVIVAVNKDAEAPIFKVVDFGIVGDLFLVIPPLKEELKKVLSE